MEQKYTIPESERDSVTKILFRYAKKAAAYGSPLTYSLSDPYAAQVAIYDTECDWSGSPVTVKTGTRMVEAFDLIIDGGVIRKGNFIVAAKIEHLSGGNVVHSFCDNADAAWGTIKPHCEHCNGNHGQRTTFIVRDGNGLKKQVGRTCLKDYCGIDPRRIGLVKQLSDIFLNLDVDHYDFSEKSVPFAYDITTALALAIRLKRSFGYVSSTEGDASNKMKLTHLMSKNERPTDAEYREAEEMVKGISELDRDEAAAHLLDNVWALVKTGYCKASHLGYVAYAPVAFDRLVDRRKKMQAIEAHRDAERKISDYVGSVGQRITVAVAEMKLLTSWDTEYGRTYLYKIVDAKGNVLIWYASKTISTDAKTIKGTIKDHNERDGVKQTVLTRCKVA